jgi:hypothetical protein
MGEGWDCSASVFFVVALRFGGKSPPPPNFQQLPGISQDLSSFWAVLNFNCRNPAEILEVTKTFLGGFLAELLVISRTKLLFEFIRIIVAGCLPMYTVLVPM